MASPLSHTLAGLSREADGDPEQHHPSLHQVHQAKCRLCGHRFQDGRGNARTKQL